MTQNVSRLCSFPYTLGNVLEGWQFLPLFFFFFFINKKTSQDYFYNTLPWPYDIHLYIILMSTSVWGLLHGDSLCFISWNSVFFFFFISSLLTLVFLFIGAFKLYSGFAIGLCLRIDQVWC